MSENYYKILELNKSASEKEIKSAYRRLARKYHPDVNPGDPTAEEKFKKINQAYQVLSDPSHRDKYDQFGQNWDKNQGMNQGFDFSDVFNSSNNSTRGFNFMSDSFDISSLFKDMANMGFQNTSHHTRTSPKKRKKPKMPKKIIYQQALHISLEDAYLAVSKEFLFHIDKAPCITCNGMKKLAGAICHNCRGSGFQESGKRLQIKIPRGIKNGENIRLRDVFTGSNNIKHDLLVNIQIDKHPIFELRSNVLYYKAKVDISDCVLGADINIPRISGKQVKLTLPSETKAGQLFKLSGQGMTNKNNGYGDMFVEIEIQLPNEMTDEHIALFNQMKNLNDEPTYTKE
jgi:molecular chaperone DnaJ